MVASTFYEIIAMVIIALVAVNKDKVVDWEQKQIKKLKRFLRKLWKKLKRFLRRQLRKSPRIVAWAEKPTKRGKPDSEWIEGQIKVFGDEWR
ncbi:MAG: hypothetical protein IKB88_02055 [Clostridia bacterium]|nr:hypothetical protein [Clostridia bacterium]